MSGVLWWAPVARYPIVLSYCMYRYYGENRGSLHEISPAPQTYNDCPLVRLVFTKRFKVRERPAAKGRPAINNLGEPANQSSLLGLSQLRLLHPIHAALPIRDRPLSLPSCWMIK